MIAGPPSRPGRFQAYIKARPVTVLMLGAVVTLAGGLVASKLELRTAFAELLPSHDPGVLALNATQRRMGDMTMLLIGIRSPDKAANFAYAEALTSKLRALPKNVCALAAWNIRDLRAFFERNKWLYVAADDLEAIRDRLRKEITKRKNPLLVDLGDDDESVEDLHKRVKGRDKLDDRFPDGVFSDKDGGYVWIAALPPGGLFAERAGEGIYDAASRLVAEDPPSRYHPQMHVHLGGPVATALASRQAVERDIVWVTTICTLLVALSIALYFKRLRAVPLVGIPAVAGTVLAFAVAEVAFGYLNSSTAFLGSIILGNGINYAIVLMSRYEEERAAGQAPAEALSRAIAGVWRGTGVAAVAASAAYASLMVTSFRGFYQFGVMGAAGALLCWVATFTILPALLLVLDHRRPEAAPQRSPLRLAPLGRLLQRHPRPLLGFVGVLTLVSIFGLGHFMQDPFEYNFRKLNAKLETSDEAKAFNHNMEDLFGRWPSPTIILGDSVDDAETIRTTIRRQDLAQGDGRRVIGQVVTIWDLLPGPPADQKRKLELIGQIRKLTHDPALEVLNDKEKKDLAQVNPPDDLHELGPTDVPALARRPFTEVNGAVGRVVLVYPIEGTGVSVWNGKDLLRIAKVIQNIKMPDGRVIETSGAAVVFGAMIRSILRDGPIATAASLLFVVLLVSLIMRPLRLAAMSLATLLAGVVWMVGGAGWAGVHVTFLNFIALPITFGIGSEYALNVVARYQEEGDVVRSVVSTGAAVALCSWTTIVGYGSLLAARNQALQGFGAMAIIGEVACLSAALIALPAVILSRARRG